MPDAIGVRRQTVEHPFGTLKAAAGRFPSFPILPPCDAHSSKAVIYRGRGLTVVGDDAQSIHSFRAATVRNPAQFSPPAR
jgi:superfamily I DNA/RNA helicase